MGIWEAILLGLIQGLTEFLPVSSSGHLVIFQDLLGLNETGITLEVMLHFGTLLSVIWVFRRDFLNLLSFRKDNQQKHLLLMLAIGVTVTAIIGLVFSSYINLLFKSTLLVGFMLLLTGGIIKLLAILPPGLIKITEMKVQDAFWVGLLQGLAVLPGISRSGSTIMAARWRGLDRETAISYSFMLAAPVILGATLVEAKEFFASGIEKAMLFNYSAGGLAAFISGIAAIKIFIKLLAGHKIHYFAYYCWAIGALVIIVSLIRL